MTHVVSKFEERMPAPARAALVIALIYVFLVGVSSLEAGIKIMGADTQERLFSAVSNPIAGLCIGILGTVLVQSSSASTSVIVGLVATSQLGVGDAVPMVMGANIGTTVTNTLVSLGHVRRSAEFKRAFAAATVHDFFNVMAVAILLPIEVIFGTISSIAEAMSERLVGASGSDWKSPVKAWVKEPVSWITDFWGGIAEGNVGGTLVVLTGLVIILSALAFITKNMRKLVAERIEQSVNNVLGKAGGAVALLLGLIITVAVQSSSITTSILIPLSAAGVLSLRNAYPVTLGANVGTTITALLAALAASSPDSLTVGLAHTTFNVLGIFLLYVIPLARDVPIRLAERLAEIAVEKRTLAVLYVLGTFIVAPLLGVALLR
ncbi:MAG: sodium dependent phosphate transporter [Actinomycetia bacterium]|nr:sodium dependent phosphate transporter [Actinomycetes bacterium]